MEPVICSAVRTPIGKFGGALKDIPAVKLGALVIKEAITRCGLRPSPSIDFSYSLSEIEKKYMNWNDEFRAIHIDEVIIGNVLQSGQGQNPARQSSIYAGIPKETPAYTVNMVCASGMKAIALACKNIKLGEGEVYIAGGMESMSNAPFVLPKARWGYKMTIDTYAEMRDVMVLDGVYEIFYGYHMGVTAENIAKKYNISRAEQDKIGLMSHNRARKAISEGKFKDEIIPVEVIQKKETYIFDVDERPMETSMEKLSALKPVFMDNGTVTAGNSAGINDGASALLIMSEKKARKLGIKPLAYIRGYSVAGVDPAYMGLGPIPATKKLLKKLNIEIDDIDIIELNEAFAAQTIACMRELNLSIDKTNLLGSGISLGHPIGCTGARLITTLVYELIHEKKDIGLATLCVGGGQGMAMLIERV